MRPSGASLYGERPEKGDARLTRTLAGAARRGDFGLPFDIAEVALSAGWRIGRGLAFCGAQLGDEVAQARALRLDEGQGAAKVHG